MRDAPTMLKKEEYASDMVQRRTHAVVMDAPTMLKKEEYASGMGQMLPGILAIMRDAPTKLSKEEYASNTEQRRNPAVVMDAPKMLETEVSAKDMEQKPNNMYRHILVYHFCYNISLCIRHTECIREEIMNVSICSLNGYINHMSLH